MFVEYSKAVVEKVKQELEKRREDAISDAEAKQNEMYAVCPVLKEIDSALAKTGLKVYKAALDNVDIKELLPDFIRENEQLLDDKKRILEMNGKPQDYLDVHFTCKICSDTGYNGLKMCSCMKMMLLKQSYASSGLGAVLTKQGFDNFNLQYYSDKKNANGTSPRDSMKHVLKSAEKYVENFGKDGFAENLLFIGKTGLGKTHISTAIAKNVLEKGYDVVYDTMQNIMNAYELQVFGHKDTQDSSVMRYTECDLLVIDDLGTEFKTSFTQSAFYNLLNTRINSGKAMIINTNLDSSSLLKKQYDDRINSRIVGNFRTFKFEGEDIRIKAAKSNKK